MLYFSLNTIIEDSDNPFHQKKSFIQDIEQIIEKEYMRFERNQQLVRLMKQNQNQQKDNWSKGFGADANGD